MPKRSGLLSCSAERRVYRQQVRRSADVMEISSNDASGPGSNQAVYTATGQDNNDAAGIRIRRHSDHQKTACIAARPDNVRH